MYRKACFCCGIGNGWSLVALLRNSPLNISRLRGPLVVRIVTWTDSRFTKFHQSRNCHLKHFLWHRVGIRTFYSKESSSRILSDHVNLYKTNSIPVNMTAAALLQLCKFRITIQWTTGIVHRLESRVMVITSSSARPFRMSTSIYLPESCLG